MLSQRAANLVFIMIMILACGYFAWIAESFETSGLLASSGLPSKFFPQLTLGAMAVCALLVGTSYWLKGSAGGDSGEPVFANAGEARRGLMMLAVTVICYLIWRWFGFVPMAILLGPMSLVAMGIHQPLIYLTVWILTAIVYAVFTYALGISLV